MRAVTSIKAKDYIVLLTIVDCVESTNQLLIVEYTVTFLTVEY
jgi:hypothetical protein